MADPCCVGGYCIGCNLWQPQLSHDLSADPEYAPTLTKLQHRLAVYSASGAPLPSIQTSTRYGKTLEPQICRNYNATGFWLPIDWFHIPPDDLPVAVAPAAEREEGTLVGTLHQ